MKYLNYQSYSKIIINNIEYVKFNDLTLEDYTETEFENIIFLNEYYRELNFYGSKFKNCIFNGVFFECSFTDCTFEKTIMRSILVDNTDLPKEYTYVEDVRLIIGPNLIFKDHEFYSVSLDNLNLHNTRFDNCVLNAVSLNKCKVNQHTLFENCIIENVMGINIASNDFNNNINNQIKIISNSNELESGILFGKDCVLRGPNSFDDDDLNITIDELVIKNDKWFDLSNLDLSILSPKDLSMFIRNISYKKDEAPKLPTSYIFNKQSEFTHDTTIYHNGFIIGPNIDLSGLDLSGLDLSGLDLSGVISENIIPTDLTDATKLPTGYTIIKGRILGPNVDLSFADLTDFDLSDINLSGAILSNVISKDVKVNNNTILPQYYEVRGGYIFGPDVDLSNKIIDWNDIDHPNKVYNNISDLYLSNIPSVSNSEPNFNGVTFTNIISQYFTPDWGGDSIPGDKIGENEYQKLPSNFIVQWGTLIGPGVDISRINNYPIGNNEFFTWLPEINVNNLNLTGINFSRTFLDGSTFTNCDLSSANFTKGNLKDVKFINCNMSDCSFSVPLWVNTADSNDIVASDVDPSTDTLTYNVKQKISDSLPLWVNQVDSNDIVASDVDPSDDTKTFTPIQDVSQTTFENTVFKNCTFYDSNFEYSDLSKNVKFSHSTLSAVNFSNANLSTVDFNNVKLNQVNFEAANLENISVSSNFFQMIDFTTTKLGQVNIIPRKTIKLGDKLLLIKENN